ncbi:OLC1v1008518C1 [Oldenlandia corymbosa var. corymbosa]|uniref:OLC1v1008518C1 n=1 Tax=Oldenlandia corymbosa var. corymbosa TaxID=529605 RepID=A0AAV1DPL4_OLDCO|nr:OLC1v1008518C1 [Oldenlandia corymbosa var. corymbosa]
MSTLFAVGCWKLWTTRNEDFFSGEYINFRSLALSIKAAANEIRRLHPRTHSPASTPSTLTAVPIWEPPPWQWIRLNTDGVVSIASSDAATGGLLRNHEGRWISGYTAKLGFCSVLEAEYWGIFFWIKDCLAAWF